VSARRISDAFARCRDEGRAALVVYLAAGDPDLETTATLARAVAEGGADVLELGVPFSDPLADGSIIQAAYTRALEGGVTVKRIIEALPRIGSESGLPLVLMTALNPVLACGPPAFCRDAAAAGAAGLLVPDLLPEDGGALRESAAAAGLDTVYLGAPDTSEERLAAAAAVSTGFFYLISRRGVTGPQDGVGDALDALVARARRYCRVPIAVGFGVTNSEDARRVAEIADGVIVGSALVKAAAEGLATARGAGESDASAMSSGADAVRKQTEQLMDGILRARTAAREVKR
jgi:tryptophan synthase alpha chain